jgi:hypothetical protein
VEANLVDVMPAERERDDGMSQPGPRRLVHLWQWIPLPLAGVYLLTVLIKFDELIASTYLNADLASAPVIGELFGGSPAHRQVVLGNMGWYSTLMFEVGTRWLPLHRQIWEAAPYALALASAGLIAWGAWRVAGRWGALVGGVLVLCAGPQTLDWLFALDDHSTTWFCLALLAALLMALLRRPAWLATPVLVPTVAVVGVVVGINGASDPLLLVAGVLPLLLAAVAAWALRPARERARASGWALACVAIAAVFDVLTHLLMRHENVVLANDSASTHNLLASGEVVASNFKLWWQSITVLGNGGFYGEVLGFASGLRLTCALLSLAAVAWVLPIAWRELSRALETRSRGATGVWAGTEAAGTARPSEPVGAREDLDAARGAWCVYWASSAVLLSASFIFSVYPENILSNRYLVGVIYAAAALLAVLMTRGILARLAVTAGTAVFALTAIVSLWQGQATGNPSNFPTGKVSGMVAEIAKREHLTVGYAGYWDAAPITWATHLGVKVYPVQVCDGGKYLCPFFLHYITSWYTPHAGQRTFLISDPTQPVAAPPLPSLGKPSAVYHIDELTMYVYPYDIAGRMQP